ncbi:DeoR/GlpR transcriptional regulator [Alphaproteobacteria bacterium KMM 3653]|uniref:DeoR/GlpR transcriptional regulator n=1 Tax=Harenicola maris TaxID=2841044 RepID=A0AAP2CM90_9RHOB|nr:DeoR/GlpR transcriptional regulator [Harenicola maris]
MATQPRKSAILSLLRSDGAVEVEALTKRFDVSAQTIRNDLRDLVAQGLAKRTHGGAASVDTAEGRAYAQRRQLRAPQKSAMGRLAASLIPNDASVILNIGTSTEQVAEALKAHEGLTILSNNVNIISTLMGSPAKELILVGGSVRPSDGAIVGSDAVDYINRFKADFAVIGASALDADGAVTDHDSREVAVARAILKNARQRILVCDHTKFAASAPVRICEIAEIDVFVTDKAPPAPFAKAARAGGTSVLTLEQNP